MTLLTAAAFAGFCFAIGLVATSPHPETQPCDQTTYQHFAHTHPELRVVECTPNSYTRVITLESGRVLKRVHAGYTIRDGIACGWFVTKGVML